MNKLKSLKFYDKYGFSLMVLELLEASFGLLILSFINNLAGDGSSIFRTLDFLLTILIYSSFTLKNIISNLVDFRVYGVGKDEINSNESIEGRINLDILRNILMIFFIMYILVIIYLALEIMRFKMIGSSNFESVFAIGVITFCINIALKDQYEKIFRDTSSVKSS